MNPTKPIKTAKPAKVAIPKKTTVKVRKCCGTDVGKDVPHMVGCRELVGLKPIYPTDTSIHLSFDGTDWSGSLISGTTTLTAKTPGRRRTLHALDTKWPGRRRVSELSGGGEALSATG